MTHKTVVYKYGTGNPVEPNGSADVRDGIDNLQSFDVFMNADEDTYNQRDGEVVRTVSGMNNEFDTMIGGMNSEFDAQILNMGFTRVGTFAAGATLTNPRQTLLWDIADGGDGQEYGWSGAFLPSGKTVPPGSTPLTTGGISVGAWMSRFDPELRVQVREALRRSYAEAGYTLVAGSFESGGALVSANDVLLHESSGKAYSGPAGPVSAGTNPTSDGFVDRGSELLRDELAGDSGYLMIPSMQVQQWRNAGDIRGWGALCDGVTDDTSAFQQAIIYSEVNDTPLFIPAGVTRITSQLIFTKPPQIRGEKYSPPVIGAFMGTPYERKGSIILSDVVSGYCIDINPSGNNEYIRGMNIIDIHILASQVGSTGFGMTINNCGWGGYSRGLVIEGFKGHGLSLSQVQDALFDQLEILQCGTEGLNPALYIHNGSNFLTFNRPRLEVNEWHLLINNCFSIEFNNSHFEQGDYPGDGAGIEFQKINNAPSIDIRNSTQVSFFGGSFTGVTLSNQIAKFGVTPSTAAYYVEVDGACTQILFSGVKLGVGYGSGKMLDMRGDGKVIGCDFFNMCTEAPPIKLTANVMFEANGIGLVDNAASPDFYCLSLKAATVRNNIIACLNSGSVDKTGGSVFACDASVKPRIGMNQVIIAKYGLFTDGNHICIDQSYDGEVYVNITDAAGTLVARKYNTNKIIVNTADGNLSSISFMVENQLLTIMHDGVTSLTIYPSANIALRGGVNAVVPKGGIIAFILNKINGVATELYRSF